MKKTFFTFFIFICLTLITGKVNSQWAGPLNLTGSSANYTGLTTNSARTIATSGSNIYTVWMDSRWWTTGDIYFRHSTNNGVNWSSEIVLTNNQPESINPSIAVHVSTLHIVWEEYRDGNAEIYYKRSTNGGVNWGGDVRLTNSAGFSEFPAISASIDGSVHIVWRDNRDGNTEIYYKRSTNEGFTWGNDIRLTNNTSSNGYPTIVTNGIGVHVAFSDYRNGNDEIYYKRSSDNGVTWIADTRLTNNTASSVEPCITTSGLNMYLTFIDTRNGGNRHVFLKKSTDLGGTWSTETQITSQYWPNYMPSLAISNNGNNLHIAYYHSSSPNFWDVFYIRSTNGGSNWAAEQRITQMSYGSHAQVAVTGTAAHIIHRWRTSNFFHIQYWRNPNGNPTGVKNTGSEILLDYSLKQNYPNPFNPSTNIEFSIPKSGKVKLFVYDMNGRMIAELVNGTYSAGIYSVDFNASNLSSGTYFYKIISGDFTDIRKMILVK